MNLITESKSPRILLITIGVLILAVLLLATGRLWLSASQSVLPVQEHQAGSNTVAGSEAEETVPEISLPINREAYQDVLMSRQFERHNDFNSLTSAAKYAREAIRLEPDYIDGYIAFAMALVSGVEQGVFKLEEVAAVITETIEAAIALDSEHGPAWTALAYYQAITGDPRAEESFVKAMQLDPGNARTLMEYGDMLQKSGHPDWALPLLIQASELDPLSQNTLLALGHTYDLLENYEEARAAYSRIREIDPSSVLGYESVSQSYLPQGQLDQALYWLREAQAVQPGNLELAGWMIFLNDSLEDYEAAQEWSEWLDSRVTKQAQPMAMQARHHYLSGNFELAIQYCNLAIRLGLENRFNSDSIFMRIKRDEALADGDPVAGIEVFATQHPLLFENQPEITADNMQQAVDLALLLKLAGREKETRHLLEAVISAYEQPYFTNGSLRAWLLPAKAEALAILGRDQAALDELRRVIDQGWRVFWRWETALNSNFIGIGKSSVFQTMISELESDIARQRARTQTMADSGLIAPPPTTSLQKDVTTNE